MAFIRQQFPDVPPDHWAYPEIQRGSFYGLVVGRPDGTFGPDDTMTRAEGTAVMVRTFERTMFLTLIVNGIVLSAVLAARRGSNA